MSLDSDGDGNCNDSPDELANDEITISANRCPNPGQHPADVHEKWTKTPKRPGRPPRDPRSQYVDFRCRDIEELENHLQEYLDHPTLPAEHATLCFTFPVSSAFMVYAAGFKNPKPTSVSETKRTPLYGKLDRTAISVIDALAQDGDRKDRMRRQKAIAKACVEACQRADGYRYSFHNNWFSNEDAACRFSYFCNDSTLNKGRASNEGAGMVGKRKRKPVYDCKGLIAVKFSATKQSLEVEYKHIPLHQTYAERAPPPRRNAKRRKLMSDEPRPVDTPSRQKRADRGPGLTPAPRMPRQTASVNDDIHNLHTGRRANETVEQQELQAVVDFLGLEDASATDQDGISRNVALSLPRVDSSTQPPTRPSSGSATPAVEKQRQKKPRRPAIPGTMAGSVQNGQLDWTLQSNRNTGSPSTNTARTNHRPLALLPGIVEAATVSESTESANVALAELAALKRKLEEAEQRIRRLEAERVASPPMASAMHPTAPVRATANSDPNSLPNSTVLANSNTTTDTRGKPVPVKANKPAGKRPKEVGTKFVIYTPGAKAGRRPRNEVAVPMGDRRPEVLDVD